MLRMESDRFSDEDPAPPDAPPRGAPDAGLGSSLYRGLQGAKRALASALFHYALVVPDKSRKDASLADMEDMRSRLSPDDDDDASESSDDGGDFDDADDGGAPPASGSSASSGGSRTFSRTASGRPLRRFGTLKELRGDLEFKEAVVEPAPEIALTPEDLAQPSASSSAPPPAARSAAPAAVPAAAAAAAAAAPVSALSALSLGSASCGRASPGLGGRNGSAVSLPPGALNLSRLRGGPVTAWEPPVYGVDIRKQDYSTVSSDGWTLHIVHTVDLGVEEGQRKQHPVLLCPGLASSGVGTFDLTPEVSIVDFLASKGWDVWCVCLRGNGASDKQSKIDISSWTIDDHLFQDVPAVLSYILNKTGKKQVHWIGHSMGGMLGCGILSQAGDSKYSEALKSLICYGSGCFGDGSWHSLLKRIVVPVTKLGFPADLACQGMSLLTDKPAALSVFETLFYWFPNVDKGVRKRLLQSCFNYIPTTLTGQFLDSHDSPDGLMNVRHTFKYADPEVLADVTVPVLAINGDWDLFCPAGGGRKTAELFGGPKEALTIGKAFGHKSHYGHFDVIVGRYAREEVWPHVVRFLEENDD